MRPPLLLAAALLAACAPGPPGPAPGASPLAVVRAQMAAFNAHDVAALADGVAPDFAWLDVAGDEVTVSVRGREAFTEGMEAYFQAFPDVRGALEDPAVSGRWVSVRERATWTGADGVRRSQVALAVYEVEDGLVRRVWYWPAVR